MAEPVFLLQIVDTRTGTVATLQAGGRLERDLITACTEAAVSQGVGFLKTEAQVRAAIATGFLQVLSALKKETRTLA